MNTAPPLVNAAGFILAPLSIMLMWVDFQLSHPCIMVLLFFVLLPVARWAWPIDAPEKLNEANVPRWIQSLLYWLPSVFALIWVVSAILLPWITDLGERSALQMGLLWLSMWISASLTMPACHELIHRSGIESLLGRILGGTCGLVAFLEEHRMHHAQSGRGRDPECADQSENVYGFAIRSGITSFLSAWDYEIAQQMRMGRAWWTNRIVWTSLVTLVMCVLWMSLQGVAGLVFYILIALATNFSIRALTFIQHWGLRQVPLETGGCGVSWVSTCLFQSWIIFNLALHEHHHHNPSRPYWKLETTPADLKLPVTYPVAFLLSLVPPLYRKVMGQRLKLWLSSTIQGERVMLQERCVIVNTR